MRRSLLFRLYNPTVRYRCFRSVAAQHLGERMRLFSLDSKTSPAPSTSSDHQRRTVSEAEVLGVVRKAIPRDGCLLTSLARQLPEEVLESFPGGLRAFLEEHPHLFFVKLIRGSSAYRVFHARQMTQAKWKVGHPSTAPELLSAVCSEAIFSLVALWLTHLFVTKGPIIQQMLLRDDSTCEDRLSSRLQAWAALFTSDLLSIKPEKKWQLFCLEENFTEKCRDDDQQRDQAGMCARPTLSAFRWREVTKDGPAGRESLSAQLTLYLSDVARSRAALCKDQRNDVERTIAMEETFFIRVAQSQTKNQNVCMKCPFDIDGVFYRKSHRDFIAHTIDWQCLADADMYRVAGLLRTSRSTALKNLDLPAREVSHAPLAQVLALAAWQQEHNITPYDSTRRGIDDQVSLRGPSMFAFEPSGGRDGTLSSLAGEWVKGVRFNMLDSYLPPELLDSRMSPEHLKSVYEQHCAAYKLCDRKAYKGVNRPTFRQKYHIYEKRIYFRMCYELSQMGVSPLYHPDVGAMALYDMLPTLEEVSAGTCEPHVSVQDVRDSFHSRVMVTSFSLDWVRRFPHLFSRVSSAQLEGIMRKDVEDALKNIVSHS